MGPTMRMLPPANFTGTGAPYATPVAAGQRNYSTLAGSTLDVPGYDAPALVSAGWAAVAPSGPTASRPAAVSTLNPLPVGTPFVDTTLNVFIVWDGATWRDVNGVAR